MKRVFSKLAFLACVFGAACVGLADGKLYDFTFKQMDIRKVILSIAALEKKSVQFSQGVGTRQIDVSLRQVTTGFAMKIITESYGYVYVQKGNVYHVMTLGERGPTSSPMVIIPLKNVLVSEIEENVKTFIGNVGSVSSNKAMNALVLSAPEDTLARVKPIIEALDQETEQVFIEAKIVETSTTFSRSLGIQWGPNLGARQNDGISFSAPGTNDTLRVGFTTAALGTKLQARLSTGEQNGEVKIISQPKVTTLNGVPANISSNITFNIRTLAATGASASSVGSIQQVKAGLQLQVTPFIVSASRIRLQINVTKSDPDFSAKIDGIPGVTDNSAQTSLIVDSGQIASIGGLVTNRSSTSEQGVPFMSKIPILGALFGSTDKEHKETELMIFLVPTVYRGSAKIQPFASGGETISEANRYVKPENAAAIGAIPAPPAAPGAPSAPAAPPPEAVVAPKLMVPPMPAPPSQLLAPKEGSLLPEPAKPLFAPESAPVLKLDPGLAPQPAPHIPPPAAPKGAIQSAPTSAAPVAPPAPVLPPASGLAAPAPVLPPASGMAAPAPVLPPASGLAAPAPVLPPASGSAPPEALGSLFAPSLVPPKEAAPAPALKLPQQAVVMPPTLQPSPDSPSLPAFTPPPETPLTLPKLEIPPSSGALALPQDSSLLPRNPQSAPSGDKAPVLKVVPDSAKTPGSLEGALLQLPTFQVPPDKAQAPPPPMSKGPASPADQALQELLGPIGPEAKAPALPAPPIAGKGN